MVARALVTLAVAVLSSPAGAQADPGPWHAVVSSPRQSFPTVTIDLGYPGPYVPWQNAPIMLRATAGDYPFDGYIGFHFRVNDHLTYDTPVISRAVLRPHEEWTFTTFARLRRFGGVGGEFNRVVPREIAVEWRGRTLRRVAVVSAGVPPWTLWNEPLRPLFVSDESKERLVLGRAAFVERASALSDEAQWYSGFSDVAVPLSMWLDLSRRVREAIFGSGVHVVFFGFPRPDQRLDDIDRALLPVVFTAKAGSYDAPWPYRGKRAMPVATPVSWTAKEGAWAVGSSVALSSPQRAAAWPPHSRPGRGQAPYIVQSAAAAWTADDAGVREPLPAAIAVPERLREARWLSGALGTSMRTIWPGPAQLLRMFPAAALSIAALIISISAWMVMRKRMRAAAMMAMLLLAGFILAARNEVRPPTAAYDLDIHTPVAAGIIRHVHAQRLYGPAPIPAGKFDAERMRTRVTGGDDWSKDAEVRTSKTPVAMGLMNSRRNWDSMTRWSVRREAGQPPVIHIRRRDTRELVFDYESPVPVNYLFAAWFAGSSMYAGGVAVPERTRGTVTIKQGCDVPEEMSEAWRWDIPAPIQRPYSGVLISLGQKHRRGSQWLSWHERQATEKSYAIAGSVNRGSDGSWSWTFALPLESTPAEATASIRIGTDSASSAVSLAWATGTMVIPPARDQRIELGSPRFYAVPAEVLRGILDGGGIVRVSVTGAESADPRAWMVIREKKS